MIDGLTIEQINMLPVPEWKLFYKKNKNSIWKRDNFDFEQREKSLQDVSNVISELNFKAYFANGVLLGAYRDNDFIKWDDDIDFDCLADDFMEHCDELKNRFTELGYIVYLNKEFGKAKMNIYRNLEKISFDVLFDLDDDYYFRFKYKWPKSLYAKTEIINFKGIEFICPSPIENYLIHCYGTDWNVPKSSHDKNLTFSREVFL